MPGKTATQEPSTTQNVTITVADPDAGPAERERYGRWRWPWLNRSLMPAGKIGRYESSVVEIAMVRTTVNVAAALAARRSRHDRSEHEDRRDDARHHVHAHGCTQRRLKTPKQPANAPS